MGENTKDYWWGLLALIMLLALIAFGFLAVLKKVSLEGAAVVITFLTTNLALLIGYRYGSSKGSKEKDGSMNQLLNDSVKK